MLTTLQISSRFNTGLLKALIPIFGPDTWGVTDADEAGSQIIIFDEGRTDEVLAAIDGYDAHVLAQAKSDRIEALAARRKDAITNGFSFNGLALRLDESTENALGKALSALQRQPAGVTVDWEVSRGVFASFDVHTVGALSDAAFAHVQAAFTRQKVLTAQVNGAEDLDALNAIDLGSGWPAPA